MGTAGAVRRRGRVLRGLSGLLAGGLVVLALVLVGAAVVGGRAGTPGPGIETLVAHVGAAVAAVAVQVYADRHDGPRGSFAAVLVVVMAGVLLVVEWLT